MPRPKKLDPVMNEKEDTTEKTEKIETTEKTQKKEKTEKKDKKLTTATSKKKSASITTTTAPIEDSGAISCKKPDSCPEANEGIPVNPLPNKNLPQMQGIRTPDEDEDPPKEMPGKDKDAKTGKKAVKKKDGMQEALDILDEYYKETPKRDSRFQQHEE